MMLLILLIGFVLSDDRREDSLVFSSFAPRYWLHEIVVESSTNDTRLSFRRAFGDDRRQLASSSSSPPSPQRFDYRYRRKLTPPADDASPAVDSRRVAAVRPVAAVSSPEFATDNADDYDNNNNRQPAAAAAASSSSLPRTATKISVLANELLARVRAQTRRSVYADAAPPPSVDCDTMGELEYSSPRPYSLLNQRGLWLARFRAVPVVVKRPISAQPSQKMSDEFEREARLLAQSDELNVIRLFGQCVQQQRNKRPLLVLERLHSWLSILTDGSSLAFVDRLALTASACRMVASWQAGGLYCADFQASTFGSSSSRSLAIPFSLFFLFLSLTSLLFIHAAFRCVVLFAHDENWVFHFV